MSKTYRCRIKRDIKEIRRSSDEVEYRLGLLDIVDEDEMNDIYREKLKQAGGRENDDGSVGLDVDGIGVDVDPAGRSARVHADEDVDVSVTMDKVIVVRNMNDDEQAAQEKAERIADQQVKEKMEQQTAEAKERAKRRIDDAAEVVKQELRHIAHETHKEALRRKAGRMGTVTAEKDEELPEQRNRLTLEVDLG